MTALARRSWRSPSKSSTPLARSMAFARKARPTTSEESESTTTGKPCLPPPCPPANKPTLFFSARSAVQNGKTFHPSNSPNEPPSSPCGKAFELFANLTPGNLYPELADLSPLRSQTVANGIGVLCVRELTGGIYFGQPKRTETLDNGELEAIDTMVYRSGEIERIIEIAVRAAAFRGGKSVRWTRQMYSKPPFFGEKS